MNTDNQYEEFAKRMEETYPKMFSRPYGGFAVGQGWWIIVERLCANIQGHINWRNKQRERELERHTAYANGYEALLKYHQGKSAEPSDWDKTRTLEVLEEGVKVPAEVTQVIVAQIKEKFGGLRFYYDGGDDEVHGMVRMAEAWADVACEECGAIGKRRDGDWIRTLCDVHEAEYQVRKSKRDE
jgi:hypothetical protein